MIKNNIVPPTISIKQREAVLCRLWSNRARLSQAEWEDLYEHVSFGLRNMCRAPELNSLGDERDSYIAQYFLLKVFEEVSHHSSPPQHFGALCVYFRNFLKDIVKSAENRYMTPFDDPDDGEESPANRVPDDCENRDETETLLREANLSETSVRLAAEAFLASLEVADQIYLACHSCADDEDAEPLSSLAKRMEIASYHYRALKLGITRKKDEFEQGYEETKIGVWLTQQLGLQCTRSYVQEIFAALKILCDESLKKYAGRLCAGKRNGGTNA